MLVKYYILIIGFLILACNSRVISKNKQKKPIPVIFETDMGNDIDDALALDMLYNYMDQRKVRILAVSTNNDDLGGTGFGDIMNTW